MSKFQCLSEIIVTCGVLMCGAGGIFERKGGRNKEKEENTTIYLSLDFGSHVEWYSFDIVLFEHKLKK